MSRTEWNDKIKSTAAMFIVCTLMVSGGYVIQFRTNKEKLNEQRYLIQEKAGYIETLEDELESLRQQTKRAELRAHP